MNNQPDKEIIQRDLQAIVDGLGRSVYAFEGKEVLLTGSCGFLGSWFIGVFDYLNKYYFQQPVRVTGIDSFIAADKINSIGIEDPEHISFRQADISRHQFGPGDTTDFIIHAAGIASPIYYRRYPIETIDGMVLGLSNLLKFASLSPVESFLYFSSSEMYGNPHYEFVPTPEDYNGNVSAIGPRSCYDESKRMGETMCVAYHKIHNIPVNWVRPFNVYGPGMRRKDDRVVPKFIYQMLTGDPVTIHVPGIQTRTFCYITDAMIGFFKTLLGEKKGEVYNIGNTSPEITIADLAYRMREMFTPTAIIQEIEMPPEYPRDQAARRCPDISKAYKHLQYVPCISLDEGLMRTWEWCKHQGDSHE